MLARPAPIVTANLDRGFNGQQDQHQQQQQRSARSRISNPLYSPMLQDNSQASPLIGHHHVSPFLEHLEPTNSPMLAPAYVTYGASEISEADPTTTSSTSTFAAPISTSSLLFSGQGGIGGGIGGRKRSTESGYLSSPLSQSGEGDNANTNGTRPNRNRSLMASSTNTSTGLKRLVTASPSLKGIDAPDSPSLRTLNHKKSDQRRREALKSSFTRLLAVIPQQVQDASAAAASASPPALHFDMDDDDNELDKDGAKLPNRVETMQMTIKYIHSLKEKNEGLDSRIDQLKRELQMLRAGQRPV
ncbi:UNVERIFIED_CONTAM: hypothetical protein HDU68_011344 [Siphonaria sp. JEL0065]|nr:hypothetical protein HDU68_011344 [Siphonaria sp. JEL0065]